MIYRNSMRHPLRSILTALGVAVALFAFCMIRTLIGAWYAGVEASAKNRLIVRNSVSLVFYLPLSYMDQIRQVPGVTKVGYGNWFGGIYKDERYRFQQFAIDENYFDIYSEFTLPPEQKQDWLGNRRGILIGKDIADNFGLKPGDPFTLKGTIFPGDWEFVVSGVFSSRTPGKDTRVMFFRWDYLNEQNKATIQRQADYVGFYVVELAPGSNTAEVSKAIDKLFANSFAESLTETETAFLQSFVSMSTTIIQTLNVVSAVVLGIMLLVLANTMLMSFRERYHEFSILKSLGFETQKLFLLIIGESMLLVSFGLVLLLCMLAPIMFIPPAKLLGELINFFPIFKVTAKTLLIALGVASFTAVISSIMPLISLSKMRISDALRRLT